MAASVALVACFAGCGGNGGADIPSGLSELSEEDQHLAAAQWNCPVSREELGSKGTPVKVTLEGQTVFLCCSNCEEPFNEDPEQYWDAVTE